MPQSSFTRGALNGALTGGSRLFQAIMRGDEIEQDARDRTMLNQSRISQAIAAAQKAQADADQTGLENEIIRSRPDAFNEMLAGRSGLPVPKVKAARDYLSTGVMPERQLPGPPTEDGIGPGSAPMVDEGELSAISRLIGRLGPMQGNVRDVDLADLARADDTYSAMDLRDAVVSGKADRNTVAGAQAAIDGKDLYNSDSTGLVLDRYTGATNASNPVAQASVQLKGAQAGRAAAAPSARTGGKAPIDRDQVAILAQELQDAKRRAATSTGDDQIRAQADVASITAELKRAGVSKLDDVPKASAPAKPPTEGQAKALLFGSRMAVADEILKELEAQGHLTPNLAKQAVEAIPGVGGALGMAVNFNVSSEQQQVEQAQRDFINAVLRRESGATIMPTEFANAQRQYFPQPGDSPEVRAQKAANRRTAIEGMKAEFGEPGLPSFLNTVRTARADRQKARKAPAATQNQQRNVRVDY